MILTNLLFVTSLTFASAQIRDKLRDKSDVLLDDGVFTDGPEDIYDSTTDPTIGIDYGNYDYTTEINDKGSEATVNPNREGQTTTEWDIDVDLRSLSLDDAKSILSRQWRASGSQDCPVCSLLHCKTVEDEKSKNKSKKRSKRSIKDLFYYDDGFVPVYDPSYYNSIELELHHKKEREDAVYEYLAKSRSKRQIHIEDFENDGFEPIYDPAYYNSIELGLDDHIKHSSDAERLLEPMHDQLKRAEISMDFRSIQARNMDPGTRCNVCECDEDAHDFPLTPDNCLLPLVQSKEATKETNSSTNLKYCKKEDHAGLFSAFTSGNGSATLAFRFQKQALNSWKFHFHFAKDFHMQMGLHKDNSSDIQIIMARPSMNKTVSYQIDMEKTIGSNGVIPRISVHSVDDKTNAFILTIGKMKMLSPLGQSDPSSVENVTVMCEDNAGGKNVNPCQQPTFGPLLARLKFSERFLQYSALGRRCMKECELSNNSSFYFCPTLPWHMKFANWTDADGNNKTSEQENRYLNWDVCSPQKTNEKGEKINLTAHGFTCTTECAKADEKTKDVMQVSEEFPYFCEVDKAINSTIEKNNVSMLCNQSKCPADGDDSFKPKDYCSPPSKLAPQVTEIDKTPQGRARKAFPPEEEEISKKETKKSKSGTKTDKTEKPKTKEKPEDKALKSEIKKEKEQTKSEGSKSGSESVTEKEPETSKKQKQTESETGEPESDPEVTTETEAKEKRKEKEGKKKPGKPKAEEDEDELPSIDDKEVNQWSRFSGRNRNKQ